MRLINVHTLRFQDFFTIPEAERPAYAILSHRWGEAEVSYKDWLKGRNQDSAGYRKITTFCQLVQRLNIDWDTRSTSDSRLQQCKIEWVWIDTCCIDKKSSSELSEAINSMYAWYKNSAICFVYLADHVSKSQTKLEDSDWFSRGWTLQELLAPSHLCFCDCKWTIFGSIDPGYRKSSEFQWYRFIDRLPQKPVDLATVTSQITGIPVDYLRLAGDPHLVSRAEPCVAQKMSWAACRKTSRKEDEAYCLLGLFQVNMPLIYGEGNRAFFRLQEEIVKQSTDKSIFAWEQPAESLSCTSLLAPSIDYTRNSGSLTWLGEALSAPYGVTNAGMRMDEPLLEAELRLSPTQLRGRYHLRNDKMHLLELNCTTKNASNILKYAYVKAENSATVHVASDFDKHRLAMDRRHEYRIYVGLQREVLKAEDWQGSLPDHSEHVKGQLRRYIRVGLVGISKKVDLSMFFPRLVFPEPYYIRLRE